ncbi:flexible cuticle protein 12-like [Cydia pomonella]|uniref:flexible cuticle protein 12-like n=1 Tax=Cydia pomonella TaxID=82600 RepID=UPI002ADE2826|nr:flexible cuticle protein 12-like [Cydia pomonella]
MSSTETAKHFVVCVKTRYLNSCTFFKLVALSCVLAAAWCAPTDPSAVRELPALRHEEVHDEYGQYALRYITAENTVVSERGRLVPTDNGGWVLEIEGQYQYISDDGQMYVTKYKGGPGGFHVDANHLPRPVLP